MKGLYFWEPLAAFISLESLSAEMPAAPAPTIPPTKAAISRPDIF